MLLLRGVDDSDLSSSDSDYSFDEDLCLLTKLDSDYSSNEDLCQMAKLEHQVDEVISKLYVPSLSTTVELQLNSEEFNQQHDTEQ